MLDTRTSRWTAATLVACLVLLAASWFLVIAPRRSQAGALRGQAASTQSQADAMRVQLNVLRAQFGDLGKRRTKLAKIKQQLPPSAQMPQLVRSLHSLSASSGVDLVSVKPGTPTASKDNPSVVEIPMTLSVRGDYFENVLFVKNLQTVLQRSFLITGLTVADADTDAGGSGGSAGSASTGTTTGGTTATPTATPAAPATVTKKAMTVSGSIFVLLDGTNSLSTVTQQAQQAASGTGTGSGSGTSTATSGSGTTAN